MKKCSICESKQKYLQRGYCSRHYQQIMLYGKILKRTIKDKNEIIDCDDYYEICIYNIKHKEIARTKIDKDDLDKAEQYKWYLKKPGYAMAHNKVGGHIFLHHLIIGKKNNLIVDHINHDSLDNRKVNLRHVTPSQNQHNRRNTIGITWDKAKKKWMAQIMVDRKHIYLGRFNNKEEAIASRRRGEKKYIKYES